MLAGVFRRQEAAASKRLLRNLEKRTVALLRVHHRLILLCDFIASGFIG